MLGRPPDRMHTLLSSNKSENGEDFFGPRGRRSPLIRLNSDKEIQGNQSLFPWKNVVRVWPDLARLCQIRDNLAAVRPPGAGALMRIRLPNKA
jgi:hypothetical protein